MSQKTLQAYESATTHTKLKRRIPAMVMVLPVAILSAVSLWGWFFYEKTSENNKQLAHSIEASEATPVNNSLNSNNVFKSGFKLIKSLLPGNYDYSNVKACILSESRCYCYDLGAAQLDVEYHVCKAIVNHGLPNRSYPVPPVTPPANSEPSYNHEKEYDYEIEGLATNQKRNI